MQFVIMADAKKTEADAVVAPAPKKSKSKWILFAVIGVAGAGRWRRGRLFMLKKPPAAEGTEAAAPAKKKADPLRRRCFTSSTNRSPSSWQPSSRMPICRPKCN
jgi:hypothetical protein